MADRPAHRAAAWGSSAWGVFRSLLSLPVDRVDQSVASGRRRDDQSAHHLVGGQVAGDQAQHLPARHARRMVDPAAHPVPGRRRAPRWRRPQPTCRRLPTCRSASSPTAESRTTNAEIDGAEFAAHVGTVEDRVDFDRGAVRSVRVVTATVSPPRVHRKAGRVAGCRIATDEPVGRVLMSCTASMVRMLHLRHASPRCLLDRRRARPRSTLHHLGGGGATPRAATASAVRRAREAITVEPPPRNLLGVICLACCVAGPGARARGGDAGSRGHHPTDRHRVVFLVGAQRARGREGFTAVKPQDRRSRPAPGVTKCAPPA